MLVQHFFVDGLAHSSYLLGGSEACAVVDPRRDVHIYLNAAKDLGLKITHILETHLHADFISGHLDLSEKTGADVYAPKSAGCEFEHVGVSEGDRFKIEDMVIETLETPGHTPEHVSYVVRDMARGERAVSVFCGDTLFVGDVGRPDLFPGKAEALASELYDSLHEKLLQLPDYCEVYPAHGAGSLCGRAMGAKRTSTIGYERLYNEPLQIEDRDQFIRTLTTNMPEAPDHFSRCSAVNAKGPTLVQNLPTPKPIPPEAFDKNVRKQDIVVLDIRSYEAFGGMHVPGAWNIDLGGNFGTYAGWVLPANQKIYLVATSEAQVTEAVTWLRRVGLDGCSGYLDAGMYGWAKRGLATAHVPQLSPFELRDIAEGEEMIQLVDVRARREFDDSSIEGAINIPFPELRTRHDALDPSMPTATLCNTGHRSSLASSVLQQHGFKHVMNVAGGMTGYAAAGLGPQCAMCQAPHGPRSRRPEPETISV